MFTDFRVPAKDLAAIMPLEKSATVIDTICSQVPDGHGFVHGAFNVITNQSMAWHAYRIGPGRFAYYELNYSKYPWDTFRVRCFHGPDSMWVTDRDVELTQRVFNFKQTPEQLPISVEITIPRFTGCTTTLERIWPYQIRLDFGAMTGAFNDLFPESVRNSWDLNTERYEDEIIDLDNEYTVRACHSAWLTVVTVLRTARITTAMVIENYYWRGVPRDARDRRPSEGSSFSWEDRGDDWENVYSSGGYLEGTALALLLPNTLTFVQLHQHALDPSRCENVS
jgi:hypothetical protein